MSTITTINGSDLITNSRAVINTNFANLNTDKMETSVLDTDTGLVANSDAKVPSQKAVKAYIDAGGSSTSITGMVIPYAGTSAPSGWLLCDGSAVDRTTYSTLFALIGTTFGSGNGSTTFNVPNLGSRTIVGVGTSTKIFTFVSRSSDTITVTGSNNSSTNEVQTGQAILYTAASGAMTGLTHNTTYYLIRVAYNEFKLASSLANAVAGTQISLSSDGTGTQTFTITLTTRTLAETGGEETHALTIAQTPVHNHEQTFVGGGGAGFNGSPQLANSVLSQNFAQTASTGSSNAHNNISPFIALNHIIKT